MSSDDHRDNRQKVDIECLVYITKPSVTDPQTVEILNHAIQNQRQMLQEHAASLRLHAATAGLRTYAAALMTATAHLYYIRGTPAGVTTVLLAPADRRSGETHSTELAPSRRLCIGVRFFAESLWHCGCIQAPESVSHLSRAASWALRAPAPPHVSTSLLQRTDDGTVDVSMVAPETCAITADAIGVVIGSDCLVRIATLLHAVVGELCAPTFYADARLRSESASVAAVLGRKQTPLWVHPAVGGRSDLGSAVDSLNDAVRCACETLSRCRERVEFLRARLVALGDTSTLDALAAAEESGSCFSVSDLAVLHQHLVHFARVAVTPSGTVVPKRLPPDAPWRICVALHLFAESVRDVVMGCHDTADVASAAAGTLAATEWSIHAADAPPLDVYGGRTLVVDGEFLCGNVMPAAICLFSVVEALLARFVDSGGVHPRGMR